MFKKFKHISLPLISFFLCALLVLLLFVYNGFQPFGTKSLVTADAAIQYLDFFAYYKDTLAGNNSFFYTFGKTLGGNCIAVFSYYLASPFTILYALFPTTSYYAVFDIVFLLKVSLAAATMCVFLQYRFKDKANTTSEYITILLSLSYALSQYTIAQSSNTMWLDGVYMLPLILMGVSKLVHEQKIIMLSVTVGLAIIFNWYSAGMNCVFAIIWFFCEYLAYHDKNCGFIRCSALFAAGMLLGVGLSAVLFLPTIKALGTGSRGSLQLGQLLNISIIGYPKAILKNYYYGRTSGYGDPALYCGLLPLVGGTAYFFSRSSRHWNGVILIIFMCLMLFWNPIVTIFSLFKIVSSYWYRYGYICIFIILFLAQEFLYNCSEKDVRIPLFSGIILALIYPCLWFNQISTHIPLILRNMALFVLSGGILTLFLKYRKTGSYAAVILLLLGVCDNMINYHLVSKSYYSEDTSFRDYAAEAKEVIDHIHSADTGNYRISQTVPRAIQDNGMTAFYNEALSYHYMSISGYTSSPDDNQKIFLENIGYRWNSSNYNITNAPVISADALLGVKYTLSPYGVKGLVQESEETYNGKYIFRNPYALPMSFIYTGQQLTLDNTDPFIYQNGLYKLLTGNTEDVYIKLDSQVNVTETDMTITLEIPEGNYAVYGNMPWVSPAAYSTLNVNNIYTIGYSAWGSPSVFPIPYEGDTAVIDLHSDALASEAYTLQFYALNLDLLDEYSTQLKAHVPDAESIENGRVGITVNDAHEGEQLFISVPQDPGWKVTVNGQPAEYELIGDCMYSFTLTKGKNIIDMKYHVPGLVTGMLCTACSAIILVYLYMRMKRKAQISND